MSMSQPIEIRRNVIKFLYEFFKEKPFNYMKIGELCSKLGVEEKDLQWNLEYLAQNGYIVGSMHKVLGSAHYIEKVKISSSGIDLIEDPSEFNRTFPDIQINVMIEKILINLQQEIENSSIPDEEKKTLLSEVKKLSEHPIVSNILSSLLLKITGIS